MSGATEKATLGGGCFWCLEAAFQLVNGVAGVVPGYAGGSTPSPTYPNLNDHAEVVRLEFDPRIISYKDILDIFWAIHDPTTLNRQGNDVGTQYRSIILYHNDEQKQQAEASLQAAQKIWDDPIITEIVPLHNFYEAEAYHHNYFQNHPNQAYCQVVINPKLQKLRAKFAAQLKAEA